jgi:hypothetical protein
MSYIFPRNTVGFTTADSLLINNLQIQTLAVGGFSIYTYDPTLPIFTVDGSTGTITTRGTLNVLGTASFTSINISNTTQSLFELASNNTTSDLLDIGMYGEYNSGSGSLFSAVYRNSADPARRWFFVNDFSCTPPIGTVPGITTANFAGVVGNNISTNNGSVSAPAYTFYSDSDTGIYTLASNSLSITAGSLNGLTITNTGSAINFTLGSTATLYYSLQSTLNDRSASGVTTGSLTLSSATSADKWQHYISTNPISGYSGSVYSFGASNHYFITDSNSALLISYTTETLSPITNSPDYRHGSKVDLVNINSVFMSVATPIYSTTTSSATTPAFTFSSSTNTGMYQQTANSVSFSAQGTQVLDLHSTFIYPSQQIQALSGTVSAPPYSFTSATTTGIFRDTSLVLENVTFALGGVNSGKFVLSSGSNPQIQMSFGTTTYPSYAFGTSGAGIYSPQIGGATQGLISVASNNSDVWIFKNRSGTTSLGLGNHQSLNALDMIPDAVTTTARLDSTSSKFTYMKSTIGSIQGYNLIDSSVLLFYRFNNSLALGTDSSESTTKINAVVVGPPAYQYSISDGSIIKKYVLDLTTNASPTSQYLNLTSYVSNFSAINTFTVSFWFRCSSVPVGDGTVINFLNTTNNKNISIIILNASDAIQVNVDSNAITTLQFNTTGVSIKNNLWHHVVLELGTGGNKLYLDGVQLLNGANLTYTSGGNGVPTAEYATNTFADLTFNRITIGGRFDGTTFSSPYTGYLYSIYMTGSKLTDAQINALYTEGSLDVYSLNVTTLNVANQSSSGQTTVGDGSVSAPAYSFTNEPNTGWYRIGAGNIGLSLLGSNALNINSTRLQNVGAFYAGDGTVGSPSYTFTSDSTSGIYLSGGSIGISNGGAAKLLISSVVQVGSGASDTTKLYIPNGSATNPSFVFISDITTGMYRIGAGNIGWSLAGILALDLNSTRLYSVNPVYLASGTVSAPGLAFNSNSGTGLYYAATNNAINIANNGVLNATFDNPSTPRLILAQGSLTVPSLTFASATNYGLFYDSAATSIKIVANGTNTAEFKSTSTNINTATTISNTCSATLYYATTNGTNSVPTFSFTNDTTSGIYLPTTGILSASANGLESLRISTSNVANSYVAIGNITNASTYTFDNTLRFAGLTGKQSSNYGFTVLSERFWTGATNSELLLFKNINSTDRIRYRAYTHVFQTPTASETYSTLLDDNSALTITGGTTSIGDGTSGSSAILKLPSGSVSVPPLSFVASANTGLYYVATNQIGISNGGTNTWLFASSGSAHISYNPLTIAANGSTTSVAINSKRISATSTQTLLNSVPIVEYNFSNTTALATDNSINNYTGGTNGTVISTTPVADSNGNSPLNAYAIQLASGAGNGVYTNTTMTEMTNTSTINATIMIQFTDLSAGALPANCWVVYGDYTTPTQNYIRLYVTTGGVLNIICVSGSTTTIQATYSSLSVNLWYQIEFVTTGTSNAIYINGSAITLSYTTGSSATSFLLNSAFTSKTGLRTYVGGGINSLNSPSCNIAYFALIQTGSSDTVATSYREQVHELVANKVTISGYPYNNSSVSLNEGYYAISSKVGQVQWDNSIQASSVAVTVNNNKDLVTSSLKMTGMIKYNYQITASTNLNLSADRTGHCFTLTANTVAITLPTGSSQSGRVFIFTWKGTPGSLTINTSGGDTIGLDASPFIYNSSTNTTFCIVYDGVSDWIFM